MDVFISYKQDERDRMRPIANALRALKVKVWFDEDLGPDKTFTDEIATVIQNCKAQLVCWSPTSVRSDWVRGEAEIGRRRGVLVAVMIERCELPPPFNMHHAEDLSGWTGATDHPGWQKVVEAIGRKLQRPGLGELAALQSSTDAQAWKRWAETHAHDPLVDDAWAKAEELEISAARARVARDRDKARRVVEAAKELPSVVAQSRPVTPEAAPIATEPPTLSREPVMIPAGPPRGHSRRLKTVLFGSAAVLVVCAAVAAWMMLRRPRMPEELTSAPAITSPDTPPPVAHADRGSSKVASSTAPADPATPVVTTAPPSSTRPAATASPAPASPRPRPSAAPAPAHSAPDSRAAALRVLDDFTAREWAISSSESLASRLLSGTPLSSLEAAANAGDARAQTLLGAAHLTGAGGAPKDDAEALRLFRLAADKGNPRAQNGLAHLYAQGRGVPRDESEAARLYRLSARQGFALAQANLGRMYATGRGVIRDDTEAARLFRLAANQGFAPALDQLGTLYRDGRGVPQDDVEAVRLYRRAAEQGLVQAEINLGLMLETGRGAPRDTTEAMRLYRLAAQQGSRQAQDRLKRLEAAR